MDTKDRAAVVIRLRETLLANANPTGGWGYYAGKRSRIEPTGWALLALAEASEQDAGAWQRFLAPHLQFLTACQRADGLLVDQPGAPPNFAANGVAACTLAHLTKGGDSGLLARLLDAIVSSKGVAFRESLTDTAVAAAKRLIGGKRPAQSAQNNTLQAWPWIPDTFSWVEPTSWCLLALKKTRWGRRDAESRIREADELLINRICATGGWNYGNAAVLGQDLRPYVQTTAVGLIALQNRRNDAAVNRTVKYLDRVRRTETSGMALGLAAVSLRLCGLPVDDVEEELGKDFERAERLGNFQTLAMMLYALSADRHGARAFRV